MFGLDILLSYFLKKYLRTSSVWNPDINKTYTLVSIEGTQYMFNIKDGSTNVRKTQGDIQNVESLITQESGWTGGARRGWAHKKTFVTYTIKERHYQTVEVIYASESLVLRPWSVNPRWTKANRNILEPIKTKTKPHKERL